MGRDGAQRDALPSRAAGGHQGFIALFTLLCVSAGVPAPARGQTRSAYCTNEYGHDWTIWKCSAYESHSEKPTHADNSYCTVR